MIRLVLEPFVVDVYCPETQQQWAMTSLIVVRAPFSTSPKARSVGDPLSSDLSSSEADTPRSARQRRADQKKAELKLPRDPVVLLHDMIVQVCWTTTVLRSSIHNCTFALEKLCT